MYATSVESVLIVGVADWVTVTTLLVIRLLDSVSVPAIADKVPVVGSVTLVLPVEVKVIELPPEVARVELLARVKVPVVVEIVRPFKEVAVATPKVGVVNVAPATLTTFPVPELSTEVIAEVPAPTRILPEVIVATPVPPLATGNVPVTSVVKTA